MNYQVAVGREYYEPTSAEKWLTLVLSIVFGIPLFIVQYFLVLLFNWLMYRLLFSIIKNYANQRLTSEDQEALAAIHSNLIKLHEPLEKFYEVLCKMKSIKIFFVTRKVKRVAQLIKDYDDLVLAYKIFMEPAHRDYYVSEEFENLRSGRDIVKQFRGTSNNVRRNTEDFSGQIVFPTYR